MFTNKYISLEDKLGYCEVYYKAGEEIDQEAAISSVASRKLYTKNTKFLCIIEPGVKFTDEAMSYFSSDASSEGINVAAVCVYNKNIFMKVIFYVHKTLMNVFLFFKRNPKIKFFSSKSKSIDWINNN